MGNFLQLDCRSVIGTLMCLTPLSNPLRPPITNTYTFDSRNPAAAYQFWTTLPSEHVFESSPAPVITGTEVKLYAAQNTNLWD